MKKLLLMAMVLFAAAGCAKDEAAGDSQPAGPDADYVPHFYGMVKLPQDAPATRGVANNRKLWSTALAKKLTVKFLDGDTVYWDYVKEVAATWEKYADVHFQFVEPTEDALIRVSFEEPRGIQTSWAYTGTDHLALFDRQDEPTVHFARWRRATDIIRRSDVLRAFGQVLGLELEYRHPGLNPEWYDEQTVRDYWEYELAEVIPWEELKKYMYDPLMDDVYLEKTKEYDPMSIMNWPFYEQIANKLKPILTDSDRRSELSELDKEFIGELYGKPDIIITPPRALLPRELMTFDSEEIKFTITITKDVAVATRILTINFETGETYYDYGEVLKITMPEGKSEHTTTVSCKNPDKFFTSLALIEYAEEDEISKPSTALRKFEIKEDTETFGVSFTDANNALESVKIVGNNPAKSCNFKFEGLQNLKEVYLPKVADAKVTLRSCPKLHTFATSRTIWKPSADDNSGRMVSAGVQLGPQYGASDEWTNDKPEVYPDTILVQPVYRPWPDGPETTFTLSDTNGAGLTIENCPALKTISLDHTRIVDLYLKNCKQMEYLYLSSEKDYIVGGGFLRPGEYLFNTIRTLPSRSNTTPGLIVVRGLDWINGNTYPSYWYVPMDRTEMTKIDFWLDENNWSLIFEHGYNEVK